MLRRGGVLVSDDLLDADGDGSADSDAGDVDSPDWDVLVESAPEGPSVESADATPVAAMTA